MGYRNNKRRAAIWLLKQLIISNERLPVTAHISADQQRTPNTTKKYGYYKFTNLVPICPYDKETLRGAIMLLFKNEHIYTHLPTSFEDAMEVWTDKFGEEALKEEVYEDEINNYKNDKYYSYLRWWLPSAAIIIAIISISLSTCKKLPSQTIQVQHIDQKMPQLDSIQRIILKEIRLRQPKYDSDTFYKDYIYFVM